MSGPVVSTTEGPIEGAALDGFERYLGIPYAAPPIGPRRFRAPQPPDRHDDVRSATEFGPHAPQPPSIMETFLGEGAPMTTSERDCLTLNVWTPSSGPGNRPVMVWVHGGAFAAGSSSSKWYDGARFATDRDVVVVSVNYRLGALGFAHVGHVGGPEFAGAGSVGVQDVAAALRWVARNVESFGGDAGNVTIFGESAGAMCVGALFALPEARGLFHKAILQSGAASSTIEPDVAGRYLEELAEILGVTATVESLQDASVEAILAAQVEVAARHPDDGVPFRPVVDGTVLARAPLDAVTAGDVAGVPLLIGTNLDEWRLFSVSDHLVAGLDESGLESAVRARFDGDAAVAVNTYRKRLAEGTPARVLENVSTDAFFRIPAIRLAEAQHAGGGAAWMYLFTWPSHGAEDGLGSCHGLELPFVFNTLDSSSATLFAGAVAPRALASDMNATWAAFATSGDPGAGAFGAWPTYDPARRATMILSDPSRLEDDPFREERALWDH